MLNMRQSIFATRPAAVLLALGLFAGFTAPFVMLQLAHAQPAPLPCTEGNHNGCTELSSTPPEDTVAVPPNIVLMFDDSGSMGSDYMPDNPTQFSGDPMKSLNAMLNASNNQVYYNPTVTYAPPPLANGSSYPSQTDMANVSVDAFGASTTTSVNLFEYDAGEDTGEVRFSTVPVVSSFEYPQNYFDTRSGYKLTEWPGKDYNFKDDDGCDNWYEDFEENRPGEKWYTYKKKYNEKKKTCTIYWSVNERYESPFFFRYSTGPKDGPYVVYYVAPAKPTGDCTKSPDPAHCVYANAVGTGSVGSSAPEGVKVGANIATWFAYYHTRMLMSKSGLMTAFDKLDPKYRFGFASINANGIIPAVPSPFVFDDSTAGGGSTENKLAVVRPYGDGSIDTQKARFWKWLAKVAPSGNTPLRKALQGAGEYYKTEQPWSSMPGDPGYSVGSSTKFACRASYTILTTDGFWNGNDPSGIGNAAYSDGPVHQVPAGNMKQYKAELPFSGGRVRDGVSSLADVATYYWANDLSSLPNEVAASTSDPASWQHMTTFTVGLGFDPVGIKPTTATTRGIFAWARGGDAIPGFSWPTPISNSVNNIADLAHAAVNGRGDFFNVKSPTELADAFSKALADISARTVAPTSAAVNASVLALGALTFRTGYSTGNWSGTFDAVTLKTDGTVDQALWGSGAGAKLDARFHSPTGFTGRKVYTGAYKLVGALGTFSPFQLTDTKVSSLDASQIEGLSMPALAGTNDTVANRINYLLGDSTYETKPYRERASILGAILHSDPVYITGATGSYRDSWPTLGSVAPPEAATGAQTYNQFALAQAARKPIVYVGANDGMLHAFHAPVPQCTGSVDSSGNCSAYTFPGGSNEGDEAWAFVPRAVYANLGNLTNANDFQFRATVDGTPVSRDVYFGGDKKWHTILAGGVGVGGRGVYGLDITDPTGFSASKVMWEFDSDMALDSACTAVQGGAVDTIGCRGTDLGYTVSQPNIGRLANGKWAVLVPNGYFPDCSTPDMPTADTASCKVVAAQAPKDAAGKPYSALFVLDAQTGKAIAELKTPSIDGVTSFGLAKVVLGDYNSDQVDDVAFAGDVQGNLWRFDLSNADPAKWAVTLVYKGVAKDGHQGVQPITTMPRLFPDPDTNRFLVLFGTGKYLGLGDNIDVNTQAIYAVRDTVATTYSLTNLKQRYLHETVVPAGGAHAGASLRCVTGAKVDTCDASSATPVGDTGSGGWYVDLYTTSGAGAQNDSGERVVVNPGAIFASNTVIFASLITGAETTNACSPSTQGAILALNATTGGSAGVSSLGGFPIAGGRTTHARTSGSLPVVSALGGGKAYLPGSTLAPSETTPISIDAPIWRRRSWRVLMNDQ